MGNVRDGYAVLGEHEIEAIQINQGIITRMAENSQKLKGLLFLIAGGMLILMRVNDVAFSVGVGAGYVVIVICLWWMDAKYLQLEQMFRKHHNAIVNGSIDYLTGWRFNPMAYKGEVKSVRQLMCTFSLGVYPVMLVAPMVACLLDAGVSRLI